MHDVCMEKRSIFPFIRQNKPKIQNKTLKKMKKTTGNRLRKV